MGRGVGLLLIALFCAEFVSAQEEVSCYGAGSIVLSVVLTLLCFAVLLGIVYLAWKKYKHKKGEFYYCLFPLALHVIVSGPLITH